MATHTEHTVRIVVTGTGVVSPLGCGSETIWARLLARQSGIRALPAELADGTGCAVGGRVPTLEEDGQAEVGDRGELAAIRAAFGSGPGVAIASSKSSTGHLMGAAGGIEAIFTILELRDQVVPSARHMPIQYALSNGFGFGGVNASLLFRRWEALR